MHSQTLGKIERWRKTLKNHILLENYFLEGELEAAITAFIEHYNHHRYHESIGNLTPAEPILAVEKPSWQKGDASNTRPSKMAA